MDVLSEQLFALSQAGAQIQTASSLQETLERITHAARGILRAHQAVTSLTTGEDWAQAIQCVSLSDKYAAWRDYTGTPDGSGIYAYLCRENRPMRLTHAELEAHPAFRGFGTERTRHPPLRGWLAAPLVGQGGRNLGLVQLSDREIGEFTAEDETLLILLAQFASVAIENIRALDSARDAEAGLRQLIETAHEGIWLIDTNARTLYANRRIADMVGTTQAEMTGRPIFDFVDPEMRSAAESLWLSRRDNRAATGEFRLRRVDGTHVWSLVSVNATYNRAGQFTGALAMVADISAAKSAQEALERSNLEVDAALRKYRRVIEASPDFTCTVDRAGLFVDVSSRSLSILGYAPGELVGRPCIDYIHAADRQRAAAELASVVAGTPTLSFECRMLHKNGGTVPMLWSSAYSEADGLTFGNGKDLTERLKIEDQLRQSQRLEAVGQLTGGVAHDFNNLLTVILGNAETLANRLASDPRLRPLAELTKKAAERGADLTNRLLAFARRQALEPQDVDANRLIADMHDLMRRTIGEHIEIKFVPTEGLWPALVDRGQLEAALLNLALNARDAMPGGGCLMIETANVDVDGAYATTRDEMQPGAYVTIAVSDTGTGMAKDVLARAFEPFFTTKEVGKGSGLGLSMVYGFVKQSGGHVNIYSEPGGGTTVRLYLPRSFAATVGETADVHGADEPGGAESILLVEDDDLVRTHVEAMLVDLGYRVVAAANGPAALAILSGPTPVDLLFTDVVMPAGMNGPQLAQRAAVMRPGLKVLFTSGYTENAIVHHGRLDAGLSLLNKPYRKRELALKLRQVLDSNAPARLD